MPIIRGRKLIDESDTRESERRFFLGQLAGMQQRAMDAILIAR
jgi:hypothetical protein